MCVIGHRSGFIEFAALMGIVTLYLNNERRKGPENNSKPGKLVWKWLDAGTDERRFFGANVSKSFPLEALLRSGYK